MKILKKLKKRRNKSVTRNSLRDKSMREPDTITKISFYLAVSDMTKEAKEAWATLLPHMSENQRQRLAHILEASFLDAATRGIDDQLREKLKLIERNYAQ